MASHGRRRGRAVAVGGGRWGIEWWGREAELFEFPSRTVTEVKDSRMCWITVGARLLMLD